MYVEARRQAARVRDSIVVLQEQMKVVVHTAVVDEEQRVCRCALESCHVTSNSEMDVCVTSLEPIVKWNTQLRIIALIAYELHLHTYDLQLYQLTDSYTSLEADTAT